MPELRDKNIASPPFDGKTLVIVDPMQATVESVDCHFVIPCQYPCQFGRAWHGICFCESA